MALSPSDRRSLIILGVVAVVALGGYFALNHGSHNAPSSPSALPGGVGVSPPAPTPEPSSSPSARPSPRLVFTGRDPFAVLVKASATPSPSPTASPTTSPGQGSNLSTIIVGGHTVTLVDIKDVGGTKKAVVRVDSDVFTVASGETFGGNFKLVSIEGSTGNFLYGDQGFTLTLNTQ
jgi:hypothetical protein